MESAERLRATLGASMQRAGSALEAADLLCHACVELLQVDGAAISLVLEATTRGTFGSSGKLSRRLDELQFTLGEGPCLDAVSSGKPVLVADLEDLAEQRWPAFRGAVLESGIGAVFALPVVLSSSRIGALDLFRRGPGALTTDALTGGLAAAELAALPLLDLIATDIDWEAAGQTENGWQQLASLERVEVYQATGMVMEALGVDPAEALVRLRAHAFAQGLSISEVAWAVVDRRLSLEADEPWPRPGPRRGGSA